MQTKIIVALVIAVVLLAAFVWSTMMMTPVFYGRQFPSAEPSGLASTIV